MQLAKRAVANATALFFYPRTGLPPWRTRGANAYRTFVCDWRYKRAYVRIRAFCSVSLLFS